jgi:hypothetical protein
MGSLYTFSSSLVLAFTSFKFSPLVGDGRSRAQRKDNETKQNCGRTIRAISYAKILPTSLRYLGFFDEEPDQALVAQKMGYCLQRFRGTTSRLMTPKLQTRQRRSLQGFHEHTVLFYSYRLLPSLQYGLQERYGRRYSRVCQGLFILTSVSFN